jgi:NAD+ synthase
MPCQWKAAKCAKYAKCADCSNIGMLCVLLLVKREESQMSVVHATDVGRLAEEIVDWLRQQAAKAGAATLVLGLSGGIDSAVVCALASRAVGPQSVIAAIMPIHSLPRDADDALAAASAAGVTPVRIDLSAVYDSFLAAMPEAADRKPLAPANVKPRLRMTTLYFLANQHNGLVVGTGNKTELSIGYFTKYGDGAVDLLPIGSLNKTMVRALARALGVPEQIIEKAPSAGLWEDQTDEAEIGLTYDLLDRALAAMAGGDEAAIEPSVRERVAMLQAASEHKRLPVPVFGWDGVG